MITGVVHRGTQTAGKRGFPTANISGNLPIGVYTATCCYGGCLVTVQSPPEIEVHIIGFCEDLYDKELTIYDIRRVPTKLTDICAVLNRGDV